MEAATQKKSKPPEPSIPAAITLPLSYTPPGHPSDVPICKTKKTVVVVDPDDLPLASAYPKKQKRKEQKRSAAAIANNDKHERSPPQQMLKMTAKTAAAKKSSTYNGAEKTHHHQVMRMVYLLVIDGESYIIKGDYMSNEDENEHIESSQVDRIVT